MFNIYQYIKNYFLTYIKMREIYKIGELRQVISEESNKNEFKPVFGPKVPEENKKINDTFLSFL